MNGYSLDDMRAPKLRDDYRRINHNAMHHKARVSLITFLRDMERAVAEHPYHYIAGVIETLNLEYPRVPKALAASTTVEKIWWSLATLEDDSEQAREVYAKLARAMHSSLSDGCDMYQPNEDVLNTRVREIIIEESDWRCAEEMMLRASEGTSTIREAIDSMGFLTGMFTEEIEVKEALTKLLVFVHEELDK